MMRERGVFKACKYKNEYGEIERSNGGKISFFKGKIVIVNMLKEIM